MVIILDKEFKSFRPTIQVNNSDNRKNEEKNKENEFLRKQVEELYQETVYLKKNIKHMKSQVRIIQLFHNIYKICYLFIYILVQ